jgi:Lon protease-like protein
MEEIGVFPLGIVLLPGEHVPLHIFEDRYKELIGECLEKGTEFGLVLSDADGVRTVGTRAAVGAVLERFDDGRMNIVVRGGARIAVEAFTDGRSFDTARIRAYEDDRGREEALDSERHRCLAAFGRLASAADADVGEPDSDAPSLAFDLAGRIAFAPEAKQELLEMRSERARVRRLTELIEAAEEALARRAAIRERATGNGHVERDR